MGYQRKDVVEKINRLLNRLSTSEQIYEWALACAVSQDFEAFSRSDPLAARAVQMLMDINEDRKVTVEELRRLEYYRQCLEEQRVYTGEQGDALTIPVPADIHAKWKEILDFDEKAADTETQFLHLLRIYVYAFACFVVVHNFWMLLQLGGPWSPRRSMAVWTFPFLVYGVLLLLPLRELVRGRLMLVIFPLSVLALGYYWVMCFQAVFGNGFHFLKFIMNLFLGAVPATGALGLLLHEKYFKLGEPEGAQEAVG